MSQSKSSAESPMSELSNQSVLTHSVSQSVPPRILNVLETVSARFGGKRLCIFLDYDGTLTPIVNEPMNAVLPADTAAVLAKLAKKVIFFILGIFMFLHSWDSYVFAFLG